MISPNIQEIYERHIKPLSPSERMRLAELIANEAVETERRQTGKRSITELHGLGAEIWKGIDAQEHVNELRKEWDHRP
jgi:hypothetical protein